MLLNFDAVPEQGLAHFCGGEGTAFMRIYHDEQNRILRGRLAPGASIGLHTHETGSEIIYILQGNGKVLYDGQEEAVSAGICHYCPKGHTHSLINNSTAELIFLAVIPQQ